VFSPRLILGPPGAGKTRRLLELFTDALGRDVLPERIALVTFTRAARQEALDRATARFAIAPKRFSWVRTIHSGAFLLLGLGRDQILAEERLKHFAALHGYELTDKVYDLDDDPLELLAKGRRRDDVLLFAFEWGRNGRLDLEHTLARCPVDSLSAPQFRLFVKRLQAFKAEHKLLDFSDLLERVLELGLRPDVDVAMIDEAHDLSPLQIAVVEMWFAGCKDTYVCADDDQAIFKWQGASPAWIRELAKRGEPEVLSQSHRVPIAVHALAQRIIAGVHERAPKEYRPTEDLGRVLVADLDQALQLAAQAKPNTSSRDTTSTVRPAAFVLVRNRLFIARVARELIERAVSFVVEGWGGRSPLSDERAVAAVKCALALARGEQGPFPTTQVRALVSYVPLDSTWIAATAREEIKSRNGQGSFMLVDLVEQLGFAPLLEVIEQHGPFAVMPKMQRDDRRYFERLSAQSGDLPDPRVVVTTIHIAKGREAPLVVIVPDMTRSTYNEYIGSGQAGHEDELRVFYVGVTRTQDTLVLVQPRTRRHFEFPKAAVEGVL
jgi:DNA helicase-2/ATP-dependent DNA helicase PcrA